MLLQDEAGGLEVEDPRLPGTFIPATPVPGTLALNVGDLLQRWSNGSFFSPPQFPRPRSSNFLILSPFAPSAH